MPPAPVPSLSHVRCWIFDLDNTLYPASADLFGRINDRITDYVATRLGLEWSAARAEQKRWFVDRGTTLAGLMDEHEVDPHDYYAFVHDVEMDALEQDAPLAAAIARLPGRKLVFTNGDRPYALKVLDRLGLGGSFEAVHDIHAMDLVPKPDPRSYRGLCDAYGLDPATCLFAEDMARNLRPAKAIGMATLWVDNGSEQDPDTDRSYIDFTTRDLAGWLESLGETA